ncbi:MAG TPA: hypothetical protein VMM12_15530 [Longimicrobiales bacterium]|nr:hypothetical protein [Longimicrobiales bacterium]
MKVDKASMSESVEARVSFLDRRVAERYGLLPSETVWRPKFGGSIAASWMDDSPAFRSFAESVVLGPRGWVDRLGLRGAMRSYFRDRRPGYPFPYPVGTFRNVAWRLLLLDLWSAKFLSRP